MKRHTLITLLSALAMASCIGQPQQAYVFAYFEGRGTDGLHLACSYDGLQWTALRHDSSFLSPCVGPDSLMRDPSIAQGPDGTFHLVWTTGWWTRSIGYASSDNLVDWSPQVALPVMEHDTATRNTWAPELFYNTSDSLFYIVWASTVRGRYADVPTSPNERGLNHRLYYTTTRNFAAFAPTRLFFDPGFSVIDGAFVRKDGRTWMVIKNETSVPTEKNLRITSSVDMRYGFPAEVSEPISGKAWAEGPTPIVVGDTMIIYFDKYREHSYGAIASTDGRHWTDISDRISLPRGIRHGTAFAVDRAVVDELMRRFAPDAPKPAR